MVNCGGMGPDGSPWVVGWVGGSGGGRAVEFGADPSTNTWLGCYCCLYDKTSDLPPNTWLCLPIIIGCYWGCLEELLLSLGFISHQILQTLHLATANRMLLGSTGASVVFMTNHLILQTHGVPACPFCQPEMIV